MPSLFLRNSSDLDDDLSVAEIASTFYDEERRPFQYAGLTFEQLPQATQTFLSNNVERLPSNVSEEELNIYFHKLLRFREAQQERLERTLEGVHRAIVAGMLADPNNEHVLKTLGDVLIPEWRSHLDDCVEQIDALIWFEMEMRKDTPFAMLPQQPFQERKEDVQRMIQFAVRCLQKINERVKRERQSEILLQEQEQETEDGQVPEGHVSDASWTSSSDEYEESQISDSDDWDCSSDSESQWINVGSDSESAFARISCTV